MATVKRGDILHKNTSRGRPPKPDKERKQKQRQAYQWRDARRVYLAGSFERWRKLRGRLQLKDSSLAWHLLETHDKGCDRCSPAGVNITADMGPDNDSGIKSIGQEKDPSQFYPGLVAALRQLCHAHLTFSECVEVMGLICVEIDHMRKDNYSLKEVVCGGTRPKGRVHERDQAQHEAVEADAVSAALSSTCMGTEKSSGSLGTDGEVNSNMECDISVEVDKRVGGPEQTACEGFLTSSSYMPDLVLPAAHDTDSRDTVSLPSAHSDSVRNYQPLAHTSEHMMAQRDSSSTNCYQIFSRTEATSDSRAPIAADHLPTTVPDRVRDFSQEEASNFAVRPTVVQVTGSTEVRSAANAALTRTLVWSDLGSCSQENTPRDGVEVREIPASHGSIQNSAYASEENVTSREVRTSSLDQVYRVDLTVYDQESPQDSLDLMTETSPKETASLKGVKSDPEASVFIVPKGTGSRESRGDFTNKSGCAARPTVIKKEPGALDTPVDSPSVGVVSSFHDIATDDTDVPLDMSVVKDEDATRGGNNHITSYPAVDATRVGGSILLQNSVENGGIYAGAEGSPDLESASAIQAASCRPETGSSSGTPSSPGSRTSSTPVTGEVLPSSVSSMAVLQQYADHVFPSPLTSSHVPSHLDSSSDRKRRHSDGDGTDGIGDGEGGPPWVRRDMTQKTEYQYLETDPFMDFGEMSRRFPNMQQRTFYRWKRRIKDQFIFLEQRPTWTYSQFSACFPQVREQVFHHWRNMMAHGHRFLGETMKLPVLTNMFGTSQFPADSGVYKDSSLGGHRDIELEEQDDRDDEDKDDEEERDETTVQYIFLQKNLGLEVEQFAQIFPGVSRQTFYAWKKQILIDFLRLQSNPQVTYQEFRKHASVTQDVFSLWKSQVAHVGSHSPVTSCTSLSTTPHSSTAPTLPPLSLLAANTGSEHLTASAELAAWYRSYAPLMGQMALPLWSPLRLMSGHALTTSSSSGHTGLCTERDEHDERESKTVKNSENNRGEVAERDHTKENDTNPSIRQAVMLATDGMGNHCGRRVSMKPEQYYFLQNPDISHSALCRLFPGVSAQRYARWRRKVASSLALLQREPHCTDEQFALYFPNVPAEILASWRRRVDQGLALAPLGTQDIGPDSALPSPRLATPISPASNAATPGGQQSHDLSISGEGGTITPNFLLEKSRSEEGRDGVKEQEATAEHMELSHLSPLQGSARKRHKPSREEFLFVQRCPQVDFTTFSSYYPGISVRTFYRWRRQVRDGMNLLRSEPSISLQNFQQLFPDVSEEVFYTWKASIQEESAAVGTTGQSPAMDNCASQTLEPSRSTLTDDVMSQSMHAADMMTSRVADVDMSLVTDDAKTQKQKCRPEQLLVHLHPYMDYAEFSRTYPGVSHRTFYRWKQEARQVMEYMRDHSDVQYEDIAAVLPDVTLEAFRKWQSLIVESEGPVSTLEKEEDGCHLSAVQSGRVMQHCHTKLPEPLASAADHAASADALSQQVCELAAGDDDDMGGGKGRRHVREEFIQVMINPSMDYAQFAQEFGTVSQRTFYRWRRHIREWRALIRENPNIDFASFSQTARDVPESVFRMWQALEHGPQQQEKTVTDLISSSSVFDSTQSRGLDSGQTVITNEMIPCVEPTDSPLNLMDSGIRGDSYGEDEGHREAHQHFLHHPKLEYEELVAVYPQVGPATLQRWKKSVGMKLEYIRSIRSTNYPDFHSLFPDVPEDVFNIWKALVLKEPRHADNFLFLSRDDSQVPLCLPAQSSSAMGMSVLPSHSGGLLSHDSQSDSESSVPISSGHHATFSGASLPPGESLQHRVSPALSTGAGRDGERGKGGVGVRVKTESPSTPLPSFTETVSNLTRLSAMLHHHLPPGLPEPAPLPPPPASVPSHVASGTGGSAAGSGNFSTVLADIVSGNVPADVTEDREDETPRLSQRQRKVHRVEYIYVQQNPEVDVQEFTKRFPGVSPRSFYRWKREIREEQDGERGQM